MLPIYTRFSESVLHPLVVLTSRMLPHAPPMFLQNQIVLLRYKNKHTRSDFTLTKNTFVYIIINTITSFNIQLFI